MVIIIIGVRQRAVSVKLSPEISQFYSVPQNLGRFCELFFLFTSRDGQVGAASTSDEDVMVSNLRGLPIDIKKNNNFFIRCSLLLLFYTVTAL